MFFMSLTDDVGVYTGSDGAPWTSLAGCLASFMMCTWCLCWESEFCDHGCTCCRSVSTWPALQRASDSISCTWPCSEAGLGSLHLTSLDFSWCILFACGFYSKPFALINLSCDYDLLLSPMSTPGESVNLKVVMGLPRYLPHKIFLQENRAQVIGNKYAFYLALGYVSTICWHSSIYIKLSWIWLMWVHSSDSDWQQWHS